MAHIYRRKGADILVNTETANNQASASLAVTADGGFIVVWSDASLIGGDASVTAIKAQRFDADGDKIGSEFLVNTTTSGSQGTPTVAVLASGRFVVTWGDLSMTGGDTSAIASRGQLFEANGTPVGSEFLVNTATNSSQQVPVVTGLAGGGFVVSWMDGSLVGGDNSSSGIKAQLFDAGGVKTGGEILVNTTILGGQSNPAIIPLGTGFAVAWNGAGGSSGGSIQFQRFNSAGVPVGTEQVATPAELRSMAGANIAAVDGGFVVVWTRGDAPQAPGPVVSDIRAQLYDAAGGKVGGEILVNTTTSGNQLAPDVDGLPGGGFLVTWQGPGTTGEGTNVFGQVFDAAGARVGVEFVLSSVASGDQGTARVEVLPSGDIVVTWFDAGGTGGDASGTAVKAQILTLDTDPPTDIALSDATLSETTADNLAIATLSATGAINTSFTYEIVSDSTGGAFRIEGNRLVVYDNDLLDFESDPSVEVRVRATDLNGNSYEENLTLTVTDAAVERRYAAGDEFVVPTDTDGAEGDPTIVSLAGGGFVMAWKPDEFGGLVHGRVFDASGVPLGGEFEIVSTVFGLDYSLTALATGGFVAVYMGPGPSEQVHARIFDDTGAALGDAIPVSNDANLNGDIAPEVALLGSGNFVVAWTIPDDGMGDPLASTIRARIFDASGAELGDAFDVSAPEASQKGNAQIAGLADGGFVVIWSALTIDGEDLKAQRFDADGDKAGAEFTLDLGAPDFEGADLAAVAGGGFVVTVIANIGEVMGFPQLEVSFRRFDENGDPAGDKIVVGTFVADSGGISDPQVTALPDGGFVITVGGDVEPADGDGETVVAYLFDASGQQAGDPFVVNQLSRGDQDKPSVAVLDSGDIVVGWLDSFLDDGVAGDRIGARIFAFKSSAIAGTPGDDTLEGTPGTDLIQGLAGNDTIHGLDGDDEIEGGAGFDMIFGEGGHDRLEGGDDDDLIEGGAGDDLIYGEAGDDALEDTSGNDQIYGGDGHDSIFAGRHAGEAASTIFIDAGAGRDFITFSGAGFIDDVTILAGSGDDRISTFRGQTIAIDAGDGNDRVSLHFLGADITIALGAGADYLVLPQLFEPIPAGGEIVVTDFETGDTGDRLELLRHMVSRLTGWDGYANPFATQHLRLIQDGADAVLQMDLDGAGGGSAFADLVRFQDRAVAAFTQYNLSGFPSNGAAPVPTDIIGTTGHDVIWGTFNPDHIQGLAGSDEIAGGAGDDLIEGGNDRDGLDGQLGNDRLYGGDGNDELFDDLGGDDALYGEAGADRLFVTRNQPAAVSDALLDGGAGNDVLIYFGYPGYLGTATLLGGDGNDDLYAKGGRDIAIDGGAGDDHVEINYVEGPYTVTLGQGYDQVYVGKFLSNFVTAPLITITDFAIGELGPATDVLFLRDYLKAVIPSWNQADNLFETGHVQLVQDGADTLIRIDRDGFAGTGAAVDFIRLQNVAPAALTEYNLNAFDSGAFDLTGTAAGEILEGSWGPNRLLGLGGADQLFGRQGNDVIGGGGGDDYVEGGGGEDYLYGEDGLDRIFGGDGNDQLFGQDGDDLLGDDGGDDDIDGGAGNDYLYAGNGADSIFGGAGNDLMFGQDDDDLIGDDDGHDYAEGGAGNDYVYTGAGNDRIFGGLGDDRLFGQSGDDQVGGGQGNDYLQGDLGLDYLYGEAGDDVLLGEADADQLYGQDGDDLIGGGEGDDLADGGLGRDYLYLGAGDDHAAGGADADSLYGQDGNDELFGNEGDDVIGDDAGNDYVEGGGGLDYLYAGLGNDTLLGDAGNDLLFGQDGDDVVGGGGNEDYIEGGSGADYLYGVDGNDTVLGGGGNDRMFGQDGDDLIGDDDGADEADGGAGQDYIYTGAGNDRIDGGAGNDRMFGQDGDDLISDDDGADEADGGGGADYVYTGAGNDRIGGGGGADQLFGQDGDDVIGGDEGNDYIEGGAGNDTLYGGAGIDTLFGCTGADNFAFIVAPLAANLQQIRDFTAGVDKLLLDDALFGGLPTGALSPDAFRLGNAAADASDRILYDAATGNLFFDSDGANGAAAVHFATLSAGLALTASDFIVF